MVDAVINMVVERLAPIIEERIRYEVDLLINFKKEAETLASTLNDIKKLLDEAEKKSVTDLRVKAWLEDIEQVSYDMDDALDELEMMRLGRETKGSQQVSGFWKKVSSFFQSFCLCPKQVSGSYGIARKIKKLNGTLELIAKENDRRFKFLPNVSECPSVRDSQGFKRDLPTSYIDVSKVRGRDEIRDELASKLLSIHGQGDHNLEIISIVGTGGLGKTTLAQLAYNDPRVNEHFEKRIWTCVSDPFDEIRIAKEIIECVEGASPNLTGFQALLERIEACISGKKFLLVLDDVWLEDEKKWTPLKMSLSNGVPGSKILVTTRKEPVANMMGTTQRQSLQPLTDPDCWLLLSQIAFQGMKKEDPSRQEKIGMEIAKRCKGLPLAVVTLGSLLRKKVTVREWEKVLESEIWELENVEVDLFPHLYLSYNELSPPVKRCFSYCAIYPKDSDIIANDVIQMWMAQGFLSSGSADEMELKGQEYFQELAASSLLQDIELNDFDNEIYACKMHDIVHDFAQYLTKNECLILRGSMDDNIVQNKKETASLKKKVRHANWQNDENASISPPVSLMCSVEKLRSFLCKGKVPPEVVRNLKCARVLCIDSADTELPSDIGNSLIHLRYLQLICYNRGKELPRSLCDLYYLQTLDVRASNNKELPDEIYKLKNLRNLLVSGEVSLPPGVRELVGLITLFEFKAQRGGSKLGYLKNLNQLEDLALTLVDLDEESDAIEAQNAQLEKKSQLRYLWLESIGRETRTDVIEALRPTSRLCFL